MHGRLAAPILAATLCMASVISAGAGEPAPVLDQSQDLESGSARLLQRRYIAQTFAPEVNGYLDSVWVHEHGPFDPTPYTVTAAIHDASTGVPDGPARAWVTVDPPGGSGWLPLNFADQNVFLVAGHSYALVLSSTDTSTEAFPYGDEVEVQWRGNPYSRGGLWEFEAGGGPWRELGVEGAVGQADLRFQTYMTVPEPGGAFVAGIAALGLMGRRQVGRRQRRV
jgi:hypothetical protein